MNRNFRVTLVVPGKFHAFYLAKGLQKKNILKSLITSYPKFIPIKERIKKTLLSQFL